MTIYLECPSCRETKEDIVWREANIGIEILDRDNIPEYGFESIDDFDEWKEEAGTQLDCPECGEPCCSSDIEAY